MASCIHPTATTTTIVQRRHNFHVLRNSAAASPPPFNSLAALCNRTLFTTDYFLRTHFSVDSHPLGRSFRLSASVPRTCSVRCRAAAPGSPSPPKLDPPPGDSPDSSAGGLMPRFSKFKDAVRIFFAVFFWMSLFFWSCIWDGRNDGRPSKRSRFRR